MATKFKVTGEYVSRKGEGRGELVPRAYECEVVLPTDDVGIARSAIQAGLVQDKVRGEVGESYVRVRTCFVKGGGKADGKVAFTEYERLLVECAERGCIPSEIVGYGEVSSRVEALGRALERHKAAAEKAEREAARLRQQAGGY
jgi:hypothetical protein